MNQNYIKETSKLLLRNVTHIMETLLMRKNTATHNNYLLKTQT